MIRRWGWGARTESGVEIQEADFHHLEILREPQIRKFGEKLAECMASQPAIPKQETSTEEQQVSLITASVQHRQQGS